MSPLKLEDDLDLLPTFYIIVDRRKSKKGAAPNLWQLTVPVFPYYSEGDAIMVIKKREKVNKKKEYDMVPYTLDEELLEDMLK
jgi:hypothetical protein